MPLNKRIPFIFFLSFVFAISAAHSIIPSVKDAHHLSGNHEDKNSEILESPQFSIFASITSEHPNICQGVNSDEEIEEEDEPDDCLLIIPHSFSISLPYKQSLLILSTSGSASSYLLGVFLLRAPPVFLS